jgi:hypothetical protein
VEIICNRNHTFWQKPNDRLNGFGCKICSGWGSLVNDKNEFILRAKNIHGDKYDYSNSIYFNMVSKLKIICKNMDYFYSHLKDI